MPRTAVFNRTIDLYSGIFKFAQKSWLICTTHHVPSSHPLVWLTTRDRWWACLYPKNSGWVTPQNWQSMALYNHCFAAVIDGFAHWINVVFVSTTHKVSTRGLTYCFDMTKGGACGLHTPNCTLDQTHLYWWHWCSVSPFYWTLFFYFIIVNENSFSFLKM